MPRDNTKYLRIGDLDDGGVYVGKSASTGRDLHAALADEPEYLSFEEALAAAEKLRAQPGRENAHVPTPAELNLNLFHNRNKGALKGTFNTSGECPGTLYRTNLDWLTWVSDGRDLSSLTADQAKELSTLAWTQWFDKGNGDLGNGEKTNRLSVRLVW